MRQKMMELEIEREEQQKALKMLQEVRAQERNDMTKAIE
jgi:hypothetical protein